jgi:uncharacterized membrane protein
MKINNCRKIIIAIGLIGILLFAMPTLAIFIKPPVGEQFSQLYMLGPNYTFDNMPFNIVEGAKNLVYLGVGNELGHPSYYTVCIKIGNQNDSIPDIDLNQPSALQTIYTYNFFLQNGETWQSPLTLQANKLSFVNTVCLLSLLELNGMNYQLDKTSSWDSQKNGYFYNLIVELWTYNSALGNVQYDNQFVLLRLNMTTD